MTDEQTRGELELPTVALLITVLPTAVFAMINFLVLRYATPIEVLAPALAFDPSLESAARLRLLAALFLFAAAAVFAFATALPAAWRLKRGSFWRAAALYMALMVAFVSATKLVDPPELQTLAGQAMVCQALSLPAPQPLLDPPLTPQDVARLRSGQIAFPPSSKSDQSVVDALNDPKRCVAPSFHSLRWLYLIQRLSMLFSGPAIVLAAIACIAMPPDQKRRPKVCRDQAARLNTILYVAAGLMVTGLIFVGAFFQWPAFALRKDAATSYQTLVAAIVFYYGVGFSLFIASFYLPVAAWVGFNWRRCSRSKATSLAVDREAGSEGHKNEASSDDAKAGADDELGLITAVQLVKIGAAIFAPAIAGLLGTVVKLPT